MIFFRFSQLLPVHSSVALKSPDSVPGFRRIEGDADSLCYLFVLNDVKIIAESKSVCKLGRSASTSGVPSPGGTPQRHLHEPHHPALSQVRHLWNICMLTCLYTCGALQKAGLVKIPSLLTLFETSSRKRIHLNSRLVTIVTDSEAYRHINAEQIRVTWLQSIATSSARRTHRSDWRKLYQQSVSFSALTQALF